MSSTLARFLAFLTPTEEQLPRARSSTPLIHCAIALVLTPLNSSALLSPAYSVMIAIIVCLDTLLQRVSTDRTVLNLPCLSSNGIRRFSSSKYRISICLDAVLFLRAWEGAAGVSRVSCSVPNSWLFLLRFVFFCTCDCICANTRLSSLDMMWV
ncbi:unnamed protein product [Periconia digitata]|uniref:Uncharacterized protein n=1 Tax=Periconia digitata TaxID=1303443 RepID=A0A9W4UTZ9_9PLEO|nr:unnamed protein product [Periconia digitata]